ncbi:MAG: RIP metalloprotease RseP [Planctomycetes bacterium]|nr:RIP metalloprotease RseP [Planctomycetota bacterium]
MDHLARIGYIGEVILGFGLLIFVHELGHFLMAKWMGVRVLKFSLGFGPRIAGFQRGDTEYLLSAIPLGGYVKMAGENLHDPTEGRPDEFFRKSPGQRACIILAGPAMNLLFAVPAAMLMYVLGTNQPSTLCDVIQNSAAAKAGLQDGDRILAVNGQTVLSFPELKIQILLAPRGEPLRLTYRRDGAPPQKATVTVVPDPNSIEVGLLPHPGTTIYQTDPGSPAEKAGIQRGDRLVSINETRIRNWEDWVAFERANPNLKAKLSLERPRPSPDGRPAYVSYQTEATFGSQSVPELGMEGRLVLLPRVEKVRPDGPAERAGLQAGDFIVRIGDKSMGTWQDLVGAISPSGGQELQFKIWRQGSLLDVSIVPRQQEAGSGSFFRHLFFWRSSASDSGPPDTGHAVIGIEAGQNLAFSIDSFWLEDAPARQAGLARGDLLFALNGKRVGDLPDSDLLGAIRKGDGTPVQLQVFRPVPDLFLEEKTVQAAPRTVAAGYFGVQPGAETVLIRHSIGRAFAESFVATGQGIEDTARSLVRLVTGNIPLKLIGGPVGISTALFYKAREGFAEFVHLLFIISLNLGLINLLPIPILDGGHLVLISAEKLKGKPIRERTVEALQYVGLAVLLALVIFATRNDIVNFF